ncbi:hypothetical protein BDR06DRAFT_100315 [Suillus hirtellus]|nr:hypothetical protein BDR06DRAFT_100315 [Suillus hirtellus]
MTLDELIKCVVFVLFPLYLLLTSTDCYQHFMMRAYVYKLSTDVLYQAGEYMPCYYTYANLYGDLYSTVATLICGTELHVRSPGKFHDDRKQTKYRQTLSLGTTNCKVQ